jgi:hypothetical protein
MSHKYGALPDPRGGGYQPRDGDDEEDERSYPLFKTYENYVRRSFENQTTNSGVFCTDYEESAYGISVTLGAVQKADKTFRNTVQSFPGSPQVDYYSDFDEMQNREAHSVFLAWPRQQAGLGRIFSGPSKRGVQPYDQPRSIILAMLTTLLVSVLSTSGEQWLHLGTKVGLL